MTLEEWAELSELEKILAILNSARKNIQNPDMFDYGVEQLDIVYSELHKFM